MGLYFSRQKLFLLIKRVHNDFMYVRFAGMRNTKTWSKSTLVFKFLHSGQPSFFASLLSIPQGRYGTRYNRPDKRFLEVP